MVSVLVCGQYLMWFVSLFHELSRTKSRAIEFVVNQ